MNLINKVVQNRTAKPTYKQKALYYTLTNGRFGPKVTRQGANLLIRKELNKRGIKP
jgi:hypothetical protein